MFTWAVFDNEGTLRGKFIDAKTAFKFKSHEQGRLVKHIESNRMCISIAHAFTFELDDLMRRYCDIDRQHYTIMYFPKGRDSNLPGSAIWEYDSEITYSTIYQEIDKRAARTRVAVSSDDVDGQVQ